MSDVIVSFDRVSLAFSKADFEVISNYNMSAPEGTYFYHDDYECFVHIDVNNNPRWFLFFKNIRLGEDECYEISRIKYVLDDLVSLPKEYGELNTEVFNIILEVFTTVNKKLHNNPRNDLFYKYFIHNISKKTYDIKASLDKIDITQFAGLLDWEFGIDRGTQNWKIEKML